jgi:hypothetical protein
VSAVVQTFPSLQAEPFGLEMSVGQVAELPVQFSAWSHWPAAGRHTVEADTKVFAGQAADVPVQVSATSQTPAEARHTVVDGWK